MVFPNQAGLGSLWGRTFGREPLWPGPRFAANGITIAGQVEDDGTWLRVSDKIFIPMKAPNLGEGQRPRAGTC